LSGSTPTLAFTPAKNLMMTFAPLDCLSIRITRGLTRVRCFASTPACLPNFIEPTAYGNLIKLQATLSTLTNDIREL
jgi:hypothetical protein